MLLSAKVINGRRVYRCECFNVKGEYRGYVLISSEFSFDMVSMIMLSKSKSKLNTLFNSDGEFLIVGAVFPNEIGKRREEEQLIKTILLTEEEENGEIPIIVDGYNYQLASSL